MSTKEVIEYMKSRHPYETDQQALDDFMVIHWATYVV